MQFQAKVTLSFDMVFVFGGHVWRQFHAVGVSLVLAP